MGWSDWFTADPGTRNSAYKNLPQGQYAAPVAVPAQPDQPVPVSNFGTQAGLAGTMPSSADVAYYAGAQNSPGILDRFIAPAPGAQNSAYKNLPRGQITAGMTGQTPADLISGYSGTGTTTQPTDQQATPDTSLPDLATKYNVSQGTPTIDPATGNLVYPTGKVEAPGGGAAQAAAATPTDNTPAGAGGGGISNLPTTLNVGSTTDNTADTSGTTDQSGQTGGLLTNIINSAQQGAQDPDAAKGFFSKMADSLKDMGDKMTNLSPAASQGLIAAGLNMLGNNSGRLNLAQLVGEGGTAGLQEYQNVKQTQIANAMAQQKMQQELLEKQQEIALRANTPSWGEPGKSYVTPGMIASGQGPIGPSQMPAASYQKYKDVNGIEHTAPFDTFGNRLNDGWISDASIPEPQQKAIRDAQTASQTASAALNKTNQFMQILSPNQIDPRTGQPLLGPDGKPLPNTNQIIVHGGIRGDVDNALARITGNQNEGQQLRQQIMTALRTDALNGFKDTGAARITQGEYQTLTNGLSDNMDNASMMNVLSLFARLQKVQADRAQVNSEFAVANRGVPGVLNQDSTILGHKYAKGTNPDDIVAGTAKPIDEPAPAAAPAAPAQAAPAAAAPATPAPVAAAPAAGGGRTIMVGGVPRTKAEIDAAIARKKANG